MTNRTKRLLACLASALAFMSPAVAGSYNNDFTSSTPTGLTLIGTGTRGDGSDFIPIIESGHLVLTYAENGLQGSAFLDALDGASTVDSFNANFKVRVGGGSSTPADGWSFVFANDLDPSTSFGEEGPTTANGITVSFDIYDNGGSEAPAIDVKVNGNTVAHKSFTIFDMLSDNFVPVNIQLNKNGSLNVSFKGNVVYTNLFLEGFAPIAGGKFAFGARTGGLNANQWVDDLSITTTVLAANVAPTITTQPANQTVAEHAQVKFSVVPEGTPPFTYQWLSNNVAVAGATGREFTIAAAPFTANGAKYKVQITNPAGNITSAEAVLTVQQDTTAPTIASVEGNENFNGLVVTFSEPVTASSAGTTGNYSLSGGLTISSATVLSPTKVALATSKQTPGASYTLTVNNVQDTASIPNMIAASSTKDFSSFVESKGFLKFEYWGNIGTVNVQTLLDDPRYQANNPDLVGYISAFNTRTIFPDDSHENYGARMTGFITPPTSGDYRFFISSDDASQLFLSTDENPANLSASPIAEEAGCCNGFAEPSATNPRASEPITLQGGKRYYVQYLLKEGGGGDYGMVAWRKEGDTTPAGTLQPISGAFLSTFANPGPVAISFTKQPQNITGAENTTVTFSVTANAAPTPVFYQWQRAEPGSSTFVDIVGANSATYTTPILKQTTDNNAKYRVVVGVPGGSSASDAATLTVVIDSTPPELVLAKAGVDFKSVTLKFSEALDPVSAAKAANYVIPNLTVSAATLAASDTVRLTTSAQAPGSNYSVTVANVKDSAGNPISATANVSAFSSLVTVAGALKYEAYTRIGGTAVQDLRNNSKYPDRPDFTTLVGNFAALSGFGDNYGARVSGFVIPSQTGDYRFFVSSDDASQLFLSTDETPEKLSAAPIAAEPGCCNAFQEPDATQTSAPIHLEAGKKYYVVYLLKEGGGGDFGEVAWRLEGDATSADQLSPIGGPSLSTAVEPGLLQSLALPTNVASPVGSGDANAPGFKARVYQVDGPGGVTLANIVSRAEQELAGIIGPNVADLSQAQNGIFNIPGVINWNQEINTGGNGGEVGDFQSTSTPAHADDPIPGMPGTGAAAHNLDNIAAELVTYVEFPTAGVYFLGVNSDDGFNVTGTDQPPANNLALVVNGTSAAGSYATASGGNGDGGVFRPITAPITGKLVYALPADACSPITNTNEIRGNIALIDRAVCTFSSKVQAAKDAGAIAVVIANSRDPGSSDGIFPIVMTGVSVDLPAVMISKPDGAKIKAALAEGVTVTLTPDATPSLGQFNAGRGASDSIFAVNVTQPGVYPLRTVWFEGGGGANLELFSVTSTGEKILLNDRTNPKALKTFRARTGFNPQPQLTISRSGAQITISWTNGGVLESSDKVDSGYTPVANASNPYTTTASKAAQFYRVRR